MSSVILTTLIFITILAYVSAELPLCDIGADTFGTWNLTSTMDPVILQTHFVDGQYSTADCFNKIWLPTDCSYHRFTNHSLNAFASHVLKKDPSKNDKLRLSFVGDSALRGILCGIGRILSGSELYGPNHNDICGNLHESPRSLPDIYKNFEVNFGEFFTLQFMYVKSMSVPNTTSLVKEVVQSRPHVFIFNTGAWDFYERGVMRAHRKLESTVDCDTKRDTQISDQRVNATTIEDYTEVGRIGRELGVKMVYRTNHHNTRFGTNCADAALLPILEKAHWEIWDNTRISEEVWKTQTWDGFHFDRTYIYTIEQHKEHIVEERKNLRESPGMLEIQLAQSLLFHLFRDTIQEFKDKGIPIPV